MTEISILFSYMDFPTRPEMTRILESFISFPIHILSLS